MAGEHILTISCDDCALQGSDACPDCVVTFLCERGTDDAVVVDEDELHAMGLLGRAGLVPALRHAPRHGVSARR
jgi:hypothetical protein